MVNLSSVKLKKKFEGDPEDQRRQTLDEVDFDFVALYRGSGAR